jgi:hypothetical protein
MSTPPVVRAPIPLTVGTGRRFQPDRRNPSPLQPVSRSKESVGSARRRAMRTFRLIVVAAVALGVAGSPGLAGANGGAYFDLGGPDSYYVGGDPDDPLIGTYFARIPEENRGILDKGPFYVYVMPTRVGIEEGEPIPAQAILVDTIEISHRAGSTYRFSTSFTMPELPTGYYKIEVCNSPCTISGFREPIGGYFTVVATQMEAALLKEREKLQAQLNGTKRELRKTTERLDSILVDLDSARLSRDALVERVTELEVEIAALEAEIEAAATATATEEQRTIVDPWVGGLIALGLGLVAAALIRKRAPETEPREGDGGPSTPGNGHSKVHELADDKVPAAR